MQQGRGGHASHGKKGSAAQRQAAAARAAQVHQQESIELATTLQLLAGSLDPTAAQPPAKKQARGAHSAGGKAKRATSYTAAAASADATNGGAAGIAHETTVGATASTVPPGLAGSLQKALAAMAAKGSIGCESNPTDSGEEISWSPNDNADGADNHVQLSAGAAGRRQHRQQLQLQRALLAAQATGQLAVQSEQVPEEHRQQLLRELAMQVQLDQQQQGVPAAEPCEADEADAAANLLSMSAADGPPGAAGGAAELGSRGGSASKAAVRELVAVLSGGAAVAAGSGRDAPAGSRHSVPAKTRAAAALKEEDLLYLMGPGMPVLARHVAPDQMLEVMRLNEMLAEAQRNAAAANAAVAAVDKILQEKRAVAELAATSAFTAARQLHGYVNGLNSQHSLMQRAAQAAVQAQHEAAAVHLPEWAAQHHHQHYVMPPAANGCAPASVNLGCGGAAGVSPLLTAVDRTPRMSAKVAGLRGGSSMVEPLDLNDCSAGPMGRSAAAVADELPADEEELEAAALLGSLHDLAALPVRAVMTSAGGVLPPGQHPTTAMVQEV
eukprot:gene2520-2821_t